MTQPRYDGVAGLIPRRAPVGVLSIGLKREVLQEWAREHPGYQVPKTTKGKTDPVMFKGDPTVAFFVKIARGDGPPGSSVMKRFRRMLEGFDDFNLDENGDPAGRGEFYGFLPAGEIFATLDGELFDDITSDDWARATIHAPYFKRERRAQKLGQMAMGNRGWEEFKRSSSYQPPRDQQAPSGHPECRGNGVERTRWEPDENGRWGWRQGQCLGDDCPFAGVCKISMDLEIHSQASAGQVAFLRYENKSANSTANFEGFLKRLYEECKTFGLDTNLYWLPFRMQAQMVSKSAGEVRGKQLKARRFPVVSFGEMMNVAEFKAGMAKLLRDGGGRLALPAGQRLLVPADEAALSDADFTPESEPPQKPRLEAVPPPEDDVIDAEPVDEPTLCECGHLFSLHGDPASPLAACRVAACNCQSPTARWESDPPGRLEPDPPGRSGKEATEVLDSKTWELLEIVPPGEAEIGDPRSIREMIQEDYVDAGLKPHAINTALVRAKLKDRKSPIPEDANRADVRMVLDSLEVPDTV